MEIGSSAANFFKRDAAQSLFGSTSADTIISAGVSDTSVNAQNALTMTIAAKREINRIRGYKLELTLAEKQRLRDIQEDIRKIDVKINDGTVRPDELDDRVAFIDEADRIIGKPIVDVEADETLKEYNNLRLAILQPRLDPTLRKRIEFMERYKDTLEKQLSESPDRLSLQRAFRGVASQLDRLNPLNSPAQLRGQAAKTYDDLVELINDHAGVKVELTVAENRRVEALQKAISDFASQVPDVSQPSAQQAARAYTALVL